MSLLYYTILYSIIFYKKSPLRKEHSCLKIFIIQLNLDECFTGMCLSCCNSAWLPVCCGTDVPIGVACIQGDFRVGMRNCKFFPYEGGYFPRYLPEKSPNWWIQEKGTLYNNVYHVILLWIFVFRRWYVTGTLLTHR